MGKLARSCVTAGLDNPVGPVTCVPQRMPARNDEQRRGLVDTNDERALSIDCAAGS